MKACQPDHNGKKTKRFKTFQVRWEIDIDAVSHRAAAKVAQDIQRDLESLSLATTYGVREGCVVPSGPWRLVTLPQGRRTPSVAPRAGKRHGDGTYKLTRRQHAMVLAALKGTCRRRIRNGRGYARNQ